MAVEVSKLSGGVVVGPPKDAVTIRAIEVVTILSPNEAAFGDGSVQTSDARRLTIIVS